jgi:hypothetical protein
LRAENIQASLLSGGVAALTFVVGSLFLKKRTGRRFGRSVLVIDRSLRHQ